MATSADRLGASVELFTAAEGEIEMKFLEEDILSWFKLDGKTALITGASGGIGSATAFALARAGADVVLVARNKGQLESVASEIDKIGTRVHIFPADITQTGHLASLVKKIEEKTNGIDILINSAGINIPQEIVDVSEEAWDSIMNINLKASFFMSQAVGRVMIRQGHGGRIINISSQTGSVALAKRSAYCASKAGLDLVTKCLARDWGQHEILVNSIAPTFIVTPMTEPFFKDEAFREYALSKNVLKRFGTTNDVAAAVLYLASPAGNMITGQVLLIDAGWTAH